MKILILTTHLNAGGISSYLLTLCAGLRKQGCDLFIISSGGDKEHEFSAIGVNLKKIDIKTKSELSLKIYKNIFSISKYIKENKIDVLHAQTRVTQVLACYLKKVCRVPVITTCHGYFKTRISRRIFPCWGDGVIAISSAVETHLVHDFKVNPGHIKLIPNGIDAARFKCLSREDKISLRKKFDLGENVLIGMTARLSDVKGQDVLIKAFRKVADHFPDAKLILVGKGKFEQNLRELTRSLQLNGNVIFRLTTENVIEYLSVLDIFVMPSRQEGLGLSILEAQASGLPVVASRVGGIPGIIKEGETGLLVASENENELAEAIIKLLNDQTLAGKLSENGRRFVENNFSADAMTEQTLQFYRQRRLSGMK